jgi:hypothetical protein
MKRTAFSSMPPSRSRWTEEIGDQLEGRQSSAAKMGAFNAHRRTTQVAAEHQVEDEEAVLVVLEGVAQVDDERVVDLGLITRASGQPRPPHDPGDKRRQRTSSSSRRSWMMLATAFILQHLALLMYLSASSCFVCLCWTTRTWSEARIGKARKGQPGRSRSTSVWTLPILPSLFPPASRPEAAQPMEGPGASQPQGHGGGQLPLRRACRQPIGDMARGGHGMSTGQAVRDCSW